MICLILSGFMTHGVHPQGVYTHLGLAFASSLGGLILKIFIIKVVQVVIVVQDSLRAASEFVLYFTVSTI